MGAKLKNAFRFDGNRLESLSPGISDFSLFCLEIFYWKFDFKTIFKSSTTSWACARGLGGHLIFQIILILYF